MILEVGFGVALAVAGIYVYKHYKMAAVVAAVKAEISKLEQEFGALAAGPNYSVAAQAVLNRLKALL